MLSTLDYGIVLMYLVITIFIGFYISKKASANIQSYFLGGNSLKWYWLGFSNSSGMFDISGTAFYVSLLFVYGIKSAWIPWLWPIWNQIIVMMFLAVWIRRSGAMTGAEWISFRFGKSLGARLAHMMVVLFASIAVIFFIGYIFNGIGKFSSSFFPNVDLSFNFIGLAINNEQSFALIVIGLTTLYSIKGGMYSVVATEVLQYLIMIACCVLVAWYAISNTDVTAVTNELSGNWKNFLPEQHLSPTWNNIPAIDNKIAGDGFSFFGLMILLMLGKGLFASLAGPVPGFDMQRILSTKTNKDAALMSGFTSLVLYIPLYLLIAGFTLLGISKFKNNFSKPVVASTIGKITKANNSTFISYADTSIKKAQFLMYNGTRYNIDSISNKNGVATIAVAKNIENITEGSNFETFRDIDFEKMLSDVVSNELPSGIKGIVIAGLLAAFMSTFSAFVNAAPAYLVNDLYKKYFKKEESDKHYVHASYLVSVIMILLGVLIGLNAQSLSVLTVWITSSLYGGYAAANYLKWIWWRFNGFGYFAGMISGLIISTYFYFWKEFWADKEGAIYQFLSTGVGSLTLFFIMLLIVTVACIVGSILTQPVEKEALNNFYEKTKPWGWWKPVIKDIKQTNNSIEPNKDLGKDMLNVTVGIIWQMSMITLPMFFVFAQWSNLWVALCTFAVTTIFIYFNWYKKLAND
jgi:solute:Na+ symporter, SSS family